MTDRQLSFGRHFSLAYEDTRRVLASMWPAVLVIVAVMMVIGFAGNLASGFIGTGLGQGILDMLIGAGSAYAISPYLVALYRAVANDEVIRNPETLRGDVATHRFAAWSALLVFVIGVPDLLFLTFGPTVPAAQMSPNDIDPMLAFTMLVLMVATWIFSVRSITLMPLLALDPGRASLTAALAQSKGSFWFIVGVLLVTMLPVMGGGLLLTVLVGGMLGPLAPILLTPLAAALFGVTVVVAIAASTRLYQRFATMRAR